ncbi:hypothetical protein [Paenibacillus sp. 1_12]|nr:hypothetical protein [Paenibacillus sp. 1_12]
MKMITGSELISNWPQVIEEWKYKGGIDVIKEATERYKKKMAL